MSRTPTVQDWARIKQAGYRVVAHAPHNGWELLDPDGHNIMIGDYGHVAPTQYEAVAEALRRIEQDEHVTLEARLLQLMSHDEAMAAEVDYTIDREQHRTLTLGELRRATAAFPDSFPITVLKPDHGDWLNVDGITKADGEHSLILATRDDFDTRQW